MWYLHICTQPPLTVRLCSQRVTVGLPHSWLHTLHILCSSYSAQHAQIFCVPVITGSRVVRTALGVEFRTSHLQGELQPLNQSLQCDLLRGGLFLASVGYRSLSVLEKRRRKEILEEKSSKGHNCLVVPLLFFLTASSHLLPCREVHLDSVWL